MAIMASICWMQGRRGFSRARVETENNVVWQDDGQEAVQGDQHDQHVQQEEEQDDDDYCSDLENNFAEDKVFNNQLSFWLAETELYNKPVSCTTPCNKYGTIVRWYFSTVVR